MGLAVARFWWPTGLAQAFASRGFAVARYDQRDAGQSTRMSGAGGGNPFAALARKRSPYSGARLVILPGVGHDLPEPLWPAIADAVRRLADQVRA